MISFSPFSLLCLMHLVGGENISYGTRMSDLELAGFANYKLRVLRAGGRWQGRWKWNQHAFWLS